jgi:hypothetical protein
VSPSAAPYATRVLHDRVTDLTVSYNSDFQKDFIERSLLLVKEYKGPHDATILLNCLLGLIIVPDAKCFEAIPSDPLEDFPSKWGIPISTIIRKPKKHHTTLSVLSTIYEMLFHIFFFDRFLKVERSIPLSFGMITTLFVQKYPSMICEFLWKGLHKR